MEKLVHGVIIGTNVLHAKKTIIDTKKSTLTLFGGLTAMPMTTAGEHLILKTTESFEFPPYCEAVITVRCVQKPAASNYVTENEVRLPCKTLIIGRTLVDASKEFLQCRVMNRTEKVIKLKAQTRVGVLAAKEVNEVKVTSEPKRAGKQLTNARKRAALEAKAISLKETVLERADLVDLIDLLYDNINLFAASLDELPSCDLLMHEIETGDNPLVNQRSYRFAPRN